MAEEPNPLSPISFFVALNLASVKASIVLAKLSSFRLKIPGSKEKAVIGECATC